MRTAYGFRRNVRIAAGSAALLFFVVLAAAGGTRPVALVREYIVRAAGPVLAAAGALGKRASGVSEEELRVLRDDQARLVAALGDVEILKKENEDLRRMASLKEDPQWRGTAANVLLYARVSGREVLVIDRGRNDGITEGDIVIDGNRLLVGAVMEAAAQSAKVSLASNEGSAFSAVLLPLGGKVLAKGIGGRAFSLELIPYDTPLRDGDMVMWTREDRRESPAVYAGRVVKGMSSASGAFKTGRAALLARPEDLAHVLVMASP